MLANLINEGFLHRTTDKVIVVALNNIDVSMKYSNLRTILERHTNIDLSNYTFQVRDLKVEDNETLQGKIVDYNRLLRVTCVIKRELHIIMIYEVLKQLDEAERGEEISLLHPVLANSNGLSKSEFNIHSNDCTN